jgi:hypothetical protein
VRVPTIHLNGTSKDDLLNALHNLASTLNVAGYEMEKVAPNGRDYYPQGPDAIREALAEHIDRAQRLKAIENEIDALYNAIEEQGGR